MKHYSRYPARPVLDVSSRSPRTVSPSPAAPREAISVSRVAELVAEGVLVEIRPGIYVPTTQADEYRRQWDEMEARRDG